MEASRAWSGSSRSDAGLGQGDPTRPEVDVVGIIEIKTHTHMYVCMYVCMYCTVMVCNVCYVCMYVCMYVCIVM